MPDVDEMIKTIDQISVVVAELRDDRERLQAAVDCAYAALNDSTYVGGPPEREARRVAVEALVAVATRHQGS